MKPRTYFRLALLFPYFLWAIFALVFFLLQSGDTSTEMNMVLMPVTFYVFGIILWFIPYTLLAIGLWIWSRNKSTTTLYKPALFAPIIFLALMLIEVILASLPAEGMADFVKSALGSAVVPVIFSLLFGYLCVGIALGTFKFLQARNLISEDASPKPKT